MGSLRKNTLRAHGVDAHVSVDKLSGLLLVSGFSLSGSPIGVPEAETLNAGFYEGKPLFSSASWACPHRPRQCPNPVLRKRVRYNSHADFSTNWGIIL